MLSARRSLPYVTACAVLVATTAFGASATAAPVALAPSGCQQPPKTTAWPQETTPPAQRRFKLDMIDPIADGSGVVVAVLDSGVDRSHDQLGDQVYAGSDPLNGAADGLEDRVGHGTLVASLIAAKHKNGVAFRGLAPGAKILPIRVSEILDDGNGGTTGKGDASTFARAIIDAANEPNVGVINMSLALNSDIPEVESAVRYALSKNKVLVAAAGNRVSGNDAPPGDAWPARYDGVLGVGAVDDKGLWIESSRQGAMVKISAPGSNVVGAAAGGKGLCQDSGTSFAAPFVAATAALVRQKYPNASQKDVVDRILATADPAPGSPEKYGVGIVNPYRALTATMDVAASVPAPAVVTDQDAAMKTQTQRRAEARSNALLFAGIVVVVVILGAAAALAIPRGMRRRWRPADPPTV